MVLMIYVLGTSLKLGILW